MSQLPESSFSFSTISLPASAESEWRFSYQFATPQPNLVVRMALGAGLLVLMIVAVNTAW